MKKLIRNYIDLLLTFYADHFTHYSYNYCFFEPLS